MKLYINLYLINYTIILNEFKKLHKILDEYEKK